MNEKQRRILQNHKPPETFSEEQLLQMLVPLAAGLLASGHYTELDEDGPVIKRSSEHRYDVVYDASFVLEDLRYHLAICSKGEAKRVAFLNNLVEEAADRPLEPFPQV